VTRWRLAALAAVLAVGAGCDRPTEPLRLPPVVVMADVRLPGVIVRGASKGWWKLATRAARYGDPLPVGVTMYCLSGTTRRGRYVREGIVAADPRFFPLAHYIELYIGGRYLGRFLVDDTGKRIRGPRIDVWTSSCRDARRFGVQGGTAVLVHKTTPAPVQAGSARPATAAFK
jgi:3D (Asp-Asp-Asp) domain-containing protein